MTDREKLKKLFLGDEISAMGAWYSLYFGLSVIIFPFYVFAFLAFSGNITYTAIEISLTVLFVTSQLFLLLGLFGIVKDFEKKKEISIRQKVNFLSAATVMITLCGILVILLEILSNIHSGYRGAKDFSYYAPKIALYLCQLIACLLPMARIPFLKNIVHIYNGNAETHPMKLYKVCLIGMCFGTVVFPLMLLTVPTLLLEIKAVDHWRKEFEQSADDTGKLSAVS